ncbi:hypothetical protein CGRA01v4_04014 [Colletotrichum graminicola]|uniref:Uncharacterized protein n=1 Tax=Colletotrichum graminicola (strain M1.001 / M2 / FGSC 10212) TaxID=645133 RepID=E3QY72_COLGM|nr:uncharacterized protein GLRG_11005 [Colletotrichum graminicola M1.001]EFQ35810.1 hypothetical protein GLRG_11005 [Colletotrichum graminicola M1.001]WDK12732.1 hypothetical protein CGRA01v4_04014 [Colletotrichum graminicola]
MAHTGQVHRETTEEFGSIHDGLAHEKLQHKSGTSSRRTPIKQAAEKATGNIDEKRTLPPMDPPKAGRGKSSPGRHVLIHLSSSPDHQAVSTFELTERARQSRGRFKITHPSHPEDYWQDLRDHVDEMSREAVLPALNLA